MTNDDVLSYLSDLIETCKDGELDFAKAMRDASDAGLKHFFMDRAQSCHASAIELREQARIFGGDAAIRGTVAGALRRCWLDVTAVLPRSSDAILEQCERGEARAKARYADALDEFLPEEVLRIIQRQYSGVVANLDRVRQLRLMRGAQLRGHTISHA